MDPFLVTLFGFLRGAVVVMLTFTVLVAFHELGHFIFARMFGAEVEAFAVGMGGRRETDLSTRLPKKLIHSGIVAAIWILACLLSGYAASKALQPLFLASIFVASVLVPLWITSRLQALYQLTWAQATKPVLSAWIVGTLMLLFATKMHFQTASLLTVLLIGSVVGLLILYYRPLLGKPEDSKMGEGELKIEGETVPVRFRPLLYRTAKSGTEYSVLCLPLGGFVSIKGMHPKEDGSEAKIPNGFFSRAPWQRLLILFAGPLFSAILGVLLIAQNIYMVGEISENAIVGKVVSGGPAANAGLQTGDRVIQIDGKKIETFLNMRSIVQRSTGKNLEIVVERGTQQLTFHATPVTSETKQPLLDEKGLPTEKMGFVGVLNVQAGMKPVSYMKALQAASVAPFLAIADFLDLIRHPASAREKGAGGTATVVSELNQSANNGFADLCGTAGMLSISLGVMNLLPIPPLDGGQMVVAIAEMFRRGKRLSMNVQMLLNQVGIMLVIGLVMLAMFLDLSKFSGK